MNLNYNVFISYRGASSGGLLGKEIYTDLKHCKNEGIEVSIAPFFAPACIQKGENFQQVICDVLKNVSCVILILSPGFFKKCIDKDDMIRFELKESLKNHQISFIPIIMEGFNFESEVSAMEEVFSVDDIYRFKHINSINHHGVYDFNTEEDVLPAVRKAMEEKGNVSVNKTETVRMNIIDFDVAKKRFVRFGNYPQTLLKDEELVHRIYEGLATNVTQKNENRYLYEGKYYYNVRENRFNKRVFESERTDGSHNFYCVESIRWIEIYSNEKFSVLIAEKIIDAKMFNLDRNAHRSSEDNELKLPNDWEVSYIRRWLNSEFYYDAFSDTERSYIQYSQISNAKESGYHTFAVHREDTTDKVFLISHEEIYRVGHGCAKVTDYARARGAYASTSATCDLYGDWWTRSPGNIDSSVENVDRRGCLEAVPFCNFVNDTAAGVRPCIIVDKEGIANGD